LNARSAWLLPTGQTREDTRVANLGALTPTSPVASRSGVLPGSSDGALRISGLSVQGGSAMGATVYPGRALIQGSDSQGAYPVALTSSLNLTFADGNAQYGRIDLVVVRVYDDADRWEASVEIVTGTPAAAPAVPAVPPLALPLYQVAVPAGTSAGTGGITWSTALVDLRTATVAVGGILPVGTESTAGSYPGQYRDANAVLQRWNGTAWVSYPQAVGGIATAAQLTTGSYPGQYRDNAGILQRWNGSAWQFTEGSSTVLFSVSQTVLQTFASGPWALARLQSVDVDDTGGWNGTTYAYTVPRSGWWRVSGHLIWQADATTGSRGSRLMVNGSTGVPRATWLTGAGPGATTVGGECLIRLSAGDTLQLHGSQTSATSVTTLGGSGYSSHLSAEWIRS
jgi:hypothetical protein